MAGRRFITGSSTTHAWPYYDEQRQHLYQLHHHAHQRRGAAARLEGVRGVAKAGRASRQQQVAEEAGHAEGGAGGVLSKARLTRVSSRLCVGPCLLGWGSSRAWPTSVVNMCV